jgi:Flp pilus assembly protein TadG
MNERTRYCGEKGQTLVELALLLPVMCLLVAGVAEYARGWFYSNTLTNGVRAGLRYASELPNLQDQDQRVKDFVFGQITGIVERKLVQSVDVPVTEENNVTGVNRGDLVSISVSCNIEPLTGGLLPDFLGLGAITRRGTMYYERSI